MRKHTVYAINHTKMDIILNLTANIIKWTSDLNKT